ncbi:MAG: redoxin domain-containing protein, partial [Planctomycetota bacterium]
LASSALVGTALAQDQGSSIGKRALDFYFTQDNNQDAIKWDWDDQRGWYTVMFSWRTTNAQSIALYEKLHGALAQWRAKGVKIFGVCSDTKELFDEFTRDRPLGAFEQHIWGRVLSEAFNLGHEPSIIIIDQFGIIRWRGDANDRWEERLEWFMEGSPPLSADAKYIGQLMRDAEKAESAGDFGKAYTFAKFTEQITDNGSSDNSRAASLKDKLEGRAVEWMKEAVAANAAGDHEKAARIIAQIVVRFGRDPEEDDGTRRILNQPQRQQGAGDKQDTRTQLIKDTEAEMAQMYADRKVRDLIETQRKNARAEVANEWAEQLERRDHLEMARTVYKATKEKFKDTDAAKTAEGAKAAEAAYDRLMKDKKALSSIEAARAEEMGFRYYDLGERYEQTGLYDLAREHYEKVLKDYAKTRIAPWAKKQLDKLPASDDKNESAKADGAGAEKKTP